MSALDSLCKNSVDEEYRCAICFLGGLNAVAEFLQCDFRQHDNTNDPRHISMRQTACLILANLAFGDGCNKALLCSSETFLETLVRLLSSCNQDLRQSVGRCDTECQLACGCHQQTQSEKQQGTQLFHWWIDRSNSWIDWLIDWLDGSLFFQVVTALMRASMQSKTESSLKVVLCALSNLSAHNDENRQDICACEGALAFLVGKLTYKSPFNPGDHLVQEYSGNVLRSISIVITVRPEYRKILRDQGCLEILVDHLKSPCIPLVENACCILWNLSAR